MAVTPNLGLTLLDVAQSQKETTINTDLNLLDTLVPKKSGDIFTGAITVNIQDTRNNLVSTAAVWKHTLSSGTAAAGMAVATEYQLQNSVATVKSAGVLRVAWNVPTNLVETSFFQFDVLLGGATVIPLTVQGDLLAAQRQPAATANYGYFSLGAGGFNGGGTNFTGAVGGTNVAINNNTAWGGDFVNYQADGSSRWQLTSASGGLIHQAWDASANTINYAYTVKHRLTSGAGAANIGVGISFEAETATAGTSNNIGAIAAQATTVTAGSVTAQMLLQVRSAGTLVTPVTITPTKIAINVHLDLSGGSAPTAVAGTQAGTTPPAPVITAGDNDQRGNITFGTGTGPAAGNMVAVTFATAYSAAPTVIVIPRNAVTAALQLYVTGNATTGFTLACGVAPAASQANTVYSFDYAVRG